MSEFSYPFDAGPGATITEDQWSYMSSNWQDDGVVADGSWTTPLKVTSASEPLILHVAAGRANIAGFHFHMDTARTIAFTANGSSFTRKDLLVLKLDRTTNTISFVYKTGTPSASPISPPIYQGWDSPEIFLATITLLAGSSVVSSANVSDDRQFIGKRIRVARNASGLPRGSISYNPDDDSVNVTKNLTTDTLASGTELNAHIVGADPHSQYQTQPEGDARYLRKDISSGLVALDGAFFANPEAATPSRYTRVGNLVHLEVNIKNISGGTVTNAVVCGTIPASAAPHQDFIIGASYVLAGGATPGGALFLNSGGQLYFLGSYTQIAANGRLIASTTYFTGI